MNVFFLSFWTVRRNNGTKREIYVKSEKCRINKTEKLKLKSQKRLFSSF